MPGCGVCGLIFCALVLVKVAPMMDVLICEQLCNMSELCFAFLPFLAETDKQKVLAVAQDWVPILDKVFGQKWCSEAWHIKEAVKAEGNTELTLSPLGTGQMSQMDALIRETLEPTCPAGQRAPDTGESQWLQPEDLEVLSSPSEHQGVLAVSPTGEKEREQLSSTNWCLCFPRGCFLF